VREFWMSWASSIKWGAASSDSYRFLLRPFQVTRHNRYKLYYYIHVTNLVDRVTFIDCQVNRPL
jgi:hypothetical protein